MAKAQRRPSDGELDLLRIIWAHDGCTAREIHQRISGTRPCKRTTTMTQLQALLGKGLVRRSEDTFPHRYHAKVGEDEITGKLVSDFVERVFGGSASRLLMHLMPSKKPSAEEIRAVKSRLRKHKSE